MLLPYYLKTTSRWDDYIYVECLYCVWIRHEIPLMLLEKPIISFLFIFLNLAYKRANLATK